MPEAQREGSEEAQQAKGQVMTERSSPGTATAMVDKIANIVSDYYDEDADGRWLKCAQHIADSLTDGAATPKEQVGPSMRTLLARAICNPKRTTGPVTLTDQIDAIMDLFTARTPDAAQPKQEPRLTDNDDGEISVTIGGKEVRGWSYKDDAERRAKMFAAREYVEGWHDGRQA
jgi:hypothetical protein